MEINWSPNEKTLKRFGLISLFAFVPVGALAWWVWHLPTLAIVLPIAGAAIWLLSMIHPPTVRYVYVGMSLLGYPIGFVVSHVILAAVYFLMFTPLALIFKLVGRDVLQRRLDPQSNTYWQPRPTRTDPAAYYRQF